MKKIKAKNFTTYVYPYDNIIELSYLNEDGEEIIIEINENVAGFISILQHELNRKTEEGES